jgi:mannose-6-phosphate isomerase-like protein (cupin superfamily)
MNDRPYAPVRPDFDGPTQIQARDVPYQIWGDSVAGEVADAVYVSNDKIHLLVFEMPAGAGFRHSPSFKTIFDADEVYYVLSGTLALNNPETGEVHRALPGESIFFGSDTWHHGFSVGSESLRVLECIAPPPEAGTTQAYARKKPDLDVVHHAQEDLIGRWPIAQEEAERAFTMKVLRHEDVLWRLEGEDPVLVGILASTERITVGKAHLLPGQRTEVQVHGGDECGYVLNGRVGVRLPEQGGENWFELHPEDGFFIPEGTPHQYCNFSNAAAELLFEIAPSYVPEGDG